MKRSVKIFEKKLSYLQKKLLFKVIHQISANSSDF